MHSVTETVLDFEFTLSDLKRLDFVLPYATLKGTDRLALVALLLQAECPETIDAQYFVLNRNQLKSKAKQMDWGAMAKDPSCGLGAKPKRVKAYSTALYRVMEQIDAALMQNFASDLKHMDWPDRLVLGDEEATPQANTTPPVLHGEAWYDSTTWKSAYADAAESKSDESREWRRSLESMQAAGAHKSYATLPDLSAIEVLKNSHPNFTEVIEFVAAQVALHKRKKVIGLALRPILLEGPAGVGKSHFAQALAKVIGTEVRALNMASQSAGFLLTGLHRSWSGGAMGEVAACLKRSETLSPIFFLDELDKSAKEGKSDPVGPLYALLEKASATRFTDEYLGVAINASQVIWIAAANDVSGLPHPLLSRFTRFSIAPPTAQEMQHMVQAHFQQLREAWTELPAQIPDTWLSALEPLSIRAMGQSLERALGRAAIRAEMAGNSPIELRAEDMQVDAQKRPGMGFLGG